MTDNIDIYRSAKLYTDQHGDQAIHQAAMQADAHLEKGDMEGAAHGGKLSRRLRLCRRPSRRGHGTETIGE